MIKNIDHINIVVSDLDKTREFFLSLGFIEVARGKLSGIWIDQIVGLEDVDAEYLALELNNTETKIELIKYFNPTANSIIELQSANQIGFRHIAFAVEDIDLEVEKLKAKGVEFFSDVKIYPANGKKLIYFYGPDNIILEFAEYKK